MASHAPQFGLALLALVVCAGCNLPAIPLDPEPDAGAEDASTDMPVEPPPGSVCIPGERF